MNFLGRVQNGVVILDDGPQLPDGTRVEVIVRERPGENANDNFPAIGTLEWGQMNQRRAELIRKKNRGGLTETEQSEYERLQRLSHQALEKQFPRPAIENEAEDRKSPQPN